MRVLIRQQARRKGGGSAHRDRELEVPKLNIGRGTDQDIEVGDLRVALRHAVLKKTGPGNIEIVSVDSSGLKVNGQWHEHKQVEIGDRIHIGNLLIERVTPPTGFDLALTTETIESTSDDRIPGVPERAVLAGTPVGKRFMSWLLFIGILFLFLGLPVAGYFSPPVQDALRGTIAPSDHAWNAGHLTLAHSHFEDDCRVCHQKAFDAVADSACRSCHQDVPDHFAVQESDSEQLVLAENCSSCHRDHNGPRGMVADDQRLCSHCHSSEALADNPHEGLAPVSDFGVDHPQFQVTLVDFDGSEAPPPRRVRVDSPDAREVATLSFPHEVHLDSAGLNSPMGAIVLQCADCHQPEPGGSLFAPIRMEQHCGGCHGLQLDAAYPQRTVPHGKPEEILFVTREYFARLAIEGAYQVAGQPAVRFASTGEALEWAHRQALSASARLFEDRACGICHQVDRSDTPDGPRWEVRPAQLTTRWFTRSRFDHSRHRTMTCTDCHAAETSASSEDVLMPGIETCRDCHGGQQRHTNRIASNCISCHSFHSHPWPDPTAVIGVDSGILQQHSVEEPVQPVATRRRRPGQ